MRLSRRGAVLAAALGIAVVVLLVGAASMRSPAEALAQYYYENTKFVTPGPGDRRCGGFIIAYSEPQVVIPEECGECVIYYLGEGELNASKYPHCKVVKGPPQPTLMPEGRKPRLPPPPVKVSEEAFRRALERAGISGRNLGTFRLNSTHLISVVDTGERRREGQHQLPVMYFLVWNNETAVAEAMQFVKVGEHSEEFVVKDGRTQASGLLDVLRLITGAPSDAIRYYRNATLVGGRGEVAWTEASGKYPLTVDYRYNWHWGAWQTPAGEYRVTAAGYFQIIYGYAVYVYSDESSSSLTDLTMGQCRFGSKAYYWYSNTEIRAYGCAGQIAWCPLPGTHVDIYVGAGYNIWAQPTYYGPNGNKWLAACCQGCLDLP